MITLYITDISQLPPEKRHTAFFLEEILPAHGYQGTPNIARGPQGKPYLLDSQGLFFNGSHSGDFMVCAISDTPVGVDIQKILPKDNPEALIRRFMTPEDLDAFKSCSEKKRLRCFYDLWAGKESYIKYLGTGFKTPMARFRRIPQGRCFGILDGRRLQKNLWLSSQTAPEGYVLWVCGHSDQVQIISRKITSRSIV